MESIILEEIPTKSPKSYSQLRAVSQSRGLIEEAFRFGQEKVLLEQDKEILGNDKMNIELDQQSYAKTANIFTFLVETMSKYHNPNGNNQSSINHVNETLTEIQLYDSDKINQTLQSKLQQQFNISKNSSRNHSLVQQKLKRPPESDQLISETADLSLDLKNQFKLKVPLESRGDALYLGFLHLGTPFSQPVKVVFDTGSEFLAVTSSLCQDSTTPEEFRFKKYDPVKRAFVQRDHTKQRCLNQAYDMNKSTSQKILSKAALKVSYGSADLQGFLFRDQLCIQSLNEEGNKTT